MKKQEFLDKLKSSLWSMPEADKQRSADYYAEMIDDRMEDGLSEEEAVAAIGDLDEIVQQILTETPRPPATVKKEEQKKQKRKVSWWETLLLVLGFPVWGSLLIAVAAVVFSVTAVTKAFTPSILSTLTKVPAGIFSPDVLRAVHSIAPSFT